MVQRMNSSNCQFKLQIKSKPSSQKVDAELYEKTIKTEIAFHWLPQISVSRFMKRVTNFQPRNKRNRNRLGHERGFLLLC